MELNVFQYCFRSQCGNLKKQNEEYRMRMERSVARLSDLENQTDQHGRVHEKMKERLKMMDDHGQHQSQQVKNFSLLT